MGYRRLYRKTGNNLPELRSKSPLAERLQSTRRERTMSYQPTRYELVLTKGETTYLIAYVLRKTAQRLLTFARQHADKIVAITGSNQIDFLGRPIEGGQVGGWMIKYTGRTEREAKQEGEHPFIKDVDIDALVEKALADKQAVVADILANGVKPTNNDRMSRPTDYTPCRRCGALTKNDRPEPDLCDTHFSNGGTL